MKYKKIANQYISENGYRICKTVGDRKSSKTIQWFIYDNNYEYVSVVSTLKFAKEIVERLSK